MGILIVLSKTECLQVIAEGLLSKHIRSNSALMSVSGYFVLERGEEYLSVWTSYLPLGFSVGNLIQDTRITYNGTTLTSRNKR